VQFKKISLHIDFVVQHEFIARQSANAPIFLGRFEDCNFNILGPDTAGFLDV